MRGATTSISRPVAVSFSFNSRTPCGVRRPRHAWRRISCGFNSRTPCGVRRRSLASISVLSVFQFTHPVRGATETCKRFSDEFRVSIHAPRAGCDHRAGRATASACVSIHAPRAGCDSMDSKLTWTINKFQFTHPVRGATAERLQPKIVIAEFQFTHPVRGATHRYRPRCHTLTVSIHAPRAGCDVPGTSTMALPLEFQFTHPVRGATDRWGLPPGTR